MAVLCISFGNENIYMGYNEGNRNQIITNDEGFRSTPSYLSFTDYDILYGFSAKTEEYNHPSSTIHDFLLFPLEPNSNKYPFKFEVEDPDKPFTTTKVNVMYQKKPNTFHYIQIVSKFFIEAKKMAETVCGRSLKKVLISVEHQHPDFHQAIKRAVKIAGFKSYFFVADSIASCCSMDLDNREKEGVTKRILVVDVGGRTKLTSLISRDGLFRVEKTLISSCGGKSVDDILFDFFLKQCERKFHAEFSKKSKTKIRKRVVAIKIALSGATRADLNVPSFFDGIDFKSTISRLRYEMLIRGVIEEVKNELKTNFLPAEPEKVYDEVVILGGCFKIPKLKSEICGFLNKYSNRIGHIEYDLQESVCYGLIKMSTGMDYQIWNNKFINPSIPEVQKKNISASNGTYYLKTKDDSKFVIFNENDILPCQKKIETEVVDSSVVIQLYLLLVNNKKKEKKEEELEGENEEEEEEEKNKDVAICTVVLEKKGKYIGNYELDEMGNILVFWIEEESKSEVCKYNINRPLSLNEKEN